VTEEGAYPRLITMRVDVKEEGYGYDPAFLLHPTIAIILKSAFVEFYKVKRVEGDKIYEMVTMLDSWEIRNFQRMNFEEFVQDASTMPLGEFVDRYMEVFNACENAIPKPQ
jgi:hypothetical protein